MTTDFLVVAQSSASDPHVAGATCALRQPPCQSQLLTEVETAWRAAKAGIAVRPQYVDRCRVVLGQRSVGHVACTAYTLWQPCRVLHAGSSEL